MFDLTTLLNTLIKKVEQGVTYRKVYTKPLLCDLELVGGIAVSQESEDHDDIHNILH